MLRVYDLWIKLTQQTRKYVEYYRRAAVADMYML